MRMSVSTNITQSFPLSESLASFTSAFIELRICAVAESVCSPISSRSLSCTFSSELISTPMCFSRLTEVEIASSWVSCSRITCCCFWRSSLIKRLLSVCAALSIVIPTLEAPAAALSLASSDSRSVPAFLAAFLVPAPALDAAGSTGSVLLTSARMLAMLSCVLSTKCLRDSTSSSVSPNLTRLPCTIRIVSSRSCRSHSIERSPESSSDVVHSYSSLSLPVADLRISFHRLCSSCTTVSECCTSSFTTLKGSSMAPSSELSLGDLGHGLSLGP
mmetsp:Transcript_5065/g.13132  ORF Transcript_5065/g.13132 Transcript_5065/m.13132 type:complete len:274 (-) Transcript_5065:66-887(-)